MDELRISELRLKNFRCFDELTLTFSTPYTILIGINGSGKSSILDALRIFFDSFSNSIRLNQAHNISFVIHDLAILPSDVRREVMLNGSILEPFPKYPTSISGVIEDRDCNIISWQNTSTKYKNVESKINLESKQLIEYLNNLNERFINGENVIL